MTQKLFLSVIFVFSCGFFGSSVHAFVHQDQVYAHLERKLATYVQEKKAQGRSDKEIVQALLNDQEMLATGEPEAQGLDKNKSLLFVCGVAGVILFIAGCWYFWPAHVAERLNLGDPALEQIIMNLPRNPQNIDYATFGNFYNDSSNYYYRSSDGRTRVSHLGSVMRYEQDGSLDVQGGGRIRVQGPSVSIRVNH